MTREWRGRGKRKMYIHDVHQKELFFGYLFVKRHARYEWEKKKEQKTVEKMKEKKWVCAIRKTRGKEWSKGQAKQTVQNDGTFLATFPTTRSRLIIIRQCPSIANDWLHATRRETTRIAILGVYPTTYSIRQAHPPFLPQNGIQSCLWQSGPDLLHFQHLLGRYELGIVVIVLKSKLVIAGMIRIFVLKKWSMTYPWTSLRVWGIYQIGFPNIFKSLPTLLGTITTVAL